MCFFSRLDMVAIAGVAFPAAASMPAGLLASQVLNQVP